MSSSDSALLLSSLSCSSSSLPLWSYSTSDSFRFIFYNASRSTSLPSTFYMSSRSPISLSSVNISSIVSSCVLLNLRSANCFARYRTNETLFSCFCFFFSLDASLLRTRTTYGPFVRLRTYENMRGKSTSSRKVLITRLPKCVPRLVLDWVMECLFWFEWSKYPLSMFDVDILPGALKKFCRYCGRMVLKIDSRPWSIANLSCNAHIFRYCWSSGAIKSFGGDVIWFVIVVLFVLVALICRCNSYNSIPRHCNMTLNQRSIGAWTAIAALPPPTVTTLARGPFCL